MEPLKQVWPKVAQYPNLFEIPSSILWLNFISTKHTILIKVNSVKEVEPIKEVWLKSIQHLSLFEMSSSM